MPTVKDQENAKELAEGFVKLSNDSNKDSTLFKEKGVSDLCREKQIRICGQCLTSNCHTKQVISTKNKMTKKFLADCKGKHLTFGEMLEALKRIEKSLEQAKTNKKEHHSKYKKPQTNGSTASIKPVESEAHEEVL